MIYDEPAASAGIKIIFLSPHARTSATSMEISSLQSRSPFALAFCPFEFNAALYAQPRRLICHLDFSLIPGALFLAQTLYIAAVYPLDKRRANEWVEKRY